MTTDERKVIPINGKDFAVPEGIPDPDCIAYLEKILALAKTGEIGGLAVAYEHNGGNVSWRAVGSFGKSRIVGALEAIKADIVDEMRKS